MIQRVEKTLKSLRKRRSQVSKVAVSEIVGVILLLGVTMIVGFAAWAWASSAAATSEKNLGNAISGNINCLNENFVITNANFSSKTPNLVTVWYFNNGNGTVTVSLVSIRNSTWSYSSATPFTVSTGGITSISYNVGTSFSVGKLYTFNAIARCQGDIAATYEQVR